MRPSLMTLQNDYKTEQRDLPAFYAANRRKNNEKLNFSAHQNMYGKPSSKVKPLVKMTLQT